MSRNAGGSPGVREGEMVVRRVTLAPGVSVDRRGPTPLGHFTFEAANDRDHPIRVVVSLKQCVNVT